MNSPAITITETEIFDFTEQEPEVDVPTLPLKLITDPQVFEQKVLALRMEHEVQKPAGIFF